VRRERSPIAGNAEAAAVERLYATAPWAFPNARFVEIADALREREGAIVEAPTHAPRG